MGEFIDDSNNFSIQAVSLILAILFGLMEGGIGIKWLGNSKPLRLHCLKLLEELIAIKTTQPLSLHCLKILEEPIMIKTKQPQTKNSRRNRVSHRLRHQKNKRPVSGM